jgi:hypothetical protein
MSPLLLIETPLWCPAVHNEGVQEVVMEEQEVEEAAEEGKREEADTLVAEAAAAARLACEVAREQRWQEEAAVGRKMEVAQTRRRAADGQPREDELAAAVSMVVAVGPVPVRVPARGLAEPLVPGGDTGVQEAPATRPDAGQHNVDIVPEEGEYERQRRERVAANQAELNRLGLGQLSVQMPAKVPRRGVPAPAWCADGTCRGVTAPTWWAGTCAVCRRYLPRSKVPRRQVAVATRFEIAENSRSDSRGASWEAQLARLVAYKVVQGDCDVPMRIHSALGSWVNSQHYLKRKLDRGEPSEGMTAERAARLTALGLVWKGTRAHFEEAAWEVQLARLAAYKAAHGDCNVPGAGPRSRG